MTYKKPIIEFVTKPTIYPNFEDLENRVFGRLIVIGYAGSSYWWCQCICGSVVKLQRKSIVARAKPSCGCWFAEDARERRQKWSKTSQPFSAKLKRTWKAIKNRCNNPRAKFFQHYGGRGIKVCDRWFYSFDNFITDMKEPPSPTHSIERKDVNGDYCPENCCWLPRNQQSKNTRVSRPVTYQNKCQVLADWAKELHLTYACLYKRVYIQNLPPEIAFTMPLQKNQFG